MTIAVFDGHTLAVDRAATAGDIKHSLQKAWVHGEHVITGVGSASLVMELRSWYLAGHGPADFPPMRSMVMGTQLLVVSRKGVMRYDASPYFIKHNLKCAFGDGAQFAYGALAMGASAAEAVAIASQYSPTCGQGMDIFTFHEDGEITHEVREP